ncbi:SEC14-like protein 2 [Oscarella lobularis]|uniref:SEC14-like protein 2 n=1 Tax=Oscarella lobularis TaxID=121494 RepID=UPI0033134C45
MSQLSSSQEKALRKFRQRVSDISDDDHELLRWLRARNFDVDKSEAMIRNHVTIREKYDLDHVLDWTPPEVLRLYQPGRFFGEDTDGNPVFYDVSGGIDMKGLMKSARESDIIKVILQNGEKTRSILKIQSDKHGKRIDLVTVVMDLEGLSLQRHFWKRGLDLYLELIRLTESNYPEQLKVCYVVNGPRILSLLYGLCKPFIADETKKKIHFLGREWKDVLRKVIHPDQLPSHYGGDAMGIDGDPACGICLGGTVPEKYFLANAGHLSKDGADCRRATISAGHKLDVNVEVTDPESTLRWEFRTEQNDIAFALMFKSQRTGSSSEDGEFLLAKEKKECDLIPEKGQYLCSQTGIYTLRFDNTSSWIKSKKIFFYYDLSK